MIIFDIENGRDLKAAAGFIKALSDKVVNNVADDCDIKALSTDDCDIKALSADDCDVTITVGNIQFKAYDHAALIQGLLDAVQYFKSELER